MDPSLSGCVEEDEMLLFVDGSLSAQRRRAVLGHLDECDVCQALAAELARDEPSSAPDPAPPSPGELVAGRFLLEKILGRGAMGTVFRAHDQTLGIDVALKLLRREPEKDAPKALRRELEVGRKITHRNVCRLHDAGSSDGYDYITMELIEGETLAQLLAREGLTQERALEVISGIAAGLGAAHALGIVHRDIKPANVMLEQTTGRVVLTDFGFATDLEAKHSRRLVGTPAYWAPEQARGERATPACDVYALGVLAYRLLADEEFSLSDPKALERVPREVRAAVARCVQPRPSDRYADATEAGAGFASRSTIDKRWPALALLVVAAGGVSWVVVHEPIAQHLVTAPTEAPLPPLSSMTSAPLPATIHEPPAPIAAASSQTPVNAISASSAPTTSSGAHRPIAPAKLVAAPSVASAIPSARSSQTPTDGDLLYRK